MSATNENANEVLVQLMQRALSGVDAAVEFGQQEIPIVVEQLLMWHFAEATIKFSLGLILAVGVIYALLKFGPRKPIDPDNDSWYSNCQQPNLFSDCDGDLCPRTIVTISIGSFALAASVALMAHLSAALKILIAPKLYLLEYGASLIK